MDRLFDGDVHFQLGERSGVTSVEIIEGISPGQRTLSKTASETEKKV